MPDLWAEAMKARQFANTIDDAENTPFTQDELKQLGPKLDEVEAFIETRQPLTPDQKSSLHSRLQYLLGAAKRGVGRFDWKNIFMGQIVQLVMDGILDSASYGHVMAHAGTLLTGLFHAAKKMIEENLQS